MTQRDASTKAPSILEFASREDEAHFWDTHDFTDYWDRFEPVVIEFANPLAEPETLLTDIETVEEVRAIAAEQDLPPDGLIHVWILECRDAERQRHLAEVNRPPDSPGRSGPSANGTAAEPPRETTA